MVKKLIGENDRGDLAEIDISKNFDERAPVVQDIQPTNILELAIKQDMTPEQIDKFWMIQEKIDASVAKKAYVRAMAAFKKEAIVIVKDTENTQFNSKYSSISALVNTAIPFLGKHNLSHNWTFAQGDGELIKVTCTLTHEDGHSESATAEGPPDVSGKKNPIQQRKSTRTYLKIETFEAVTGLVSSENNLDDDGNASEMQCITEDQALEIEGMIEDLKEKEKAWLDWLGGFATVRDIPAKKYRQMITALKARAK